jgi:hypothetical protein
MRTEAFTTGRDPTIKGVNMKTGYEVNDIRKKHGGLHINVGLEECIRVIFNGRELKITYIGENAEGMQCFSFMGPKDFTIISPNLARKVDVRNWTSK